MLLLLACYVPDPKLPPEDTDTGGGVETGETADTVDTAETGETGETADTTETADTEETAVDTVDTQDTDDCPTVYADADGDGYGDPTKPQDGCLDTGVTVSDNTDCDDADAEIHPGATERCDLADDDCDGDAADLGIVTWTADSGAWVDYTSTFAATGDVAIGEGTIDVCPGTYYVRPYLVVGDAAVVGHGGPIFDGGGGGSVFTVTSGSLGLTDLVIQNGDADYGSSFGLPGGGGVACADAVLTLDGVTVASNSASVGGGVLVDHCDATLTDSYLSGNYADSGGAISSAGGALVLTRTEVAFNSSLNYGGGIDLEGVDTTASLEMVDSNVHTNSAEYGGGVTAVYDATVSCTGSSSVQAGIWQNGATYGGGLMLFGAEAGAPTFTGTACDFGQADAGESNQPEDILLMDEGVSYKDLGDDANVSCTHVSCG